MQLLHRFRKPDMLLVQSMFMWSLVLGLSGNWCAMKGTRADPNESLCVTTFFRNQSTQNTIWSHIKKTSDPASEFFSKHLSYQEISGILVEDIEIVRNTKNFFQRAGGFNFAVTLDMLDFCMKVKDFEQFLGAKLIHYYLMDQKVSTISKNLLIIRMEGSFPDDVKVLFETFQIQYISNLEAPPKLCSPKKEQDEHTASDFPSPVLFMMNSGVCSSVPNSTLFISDVFPLCPSKESHPVFSYNTSYPCSDSGSSITGFQYFMNYNLSGQVNKQFEMFVPLEDCECYTGTPSSPVLCMVPAITNLNSNVVYSVTIASVFNGTVGSRTRVEAKMLPQQIYFPNELRILAQMPSNYSGSSGKVIQSSVQFLNQTATQSDLDTFGNLFGVPIETMQRFGDLDVNVTIAAGEASLDQQILMTMGRNITLGVWQNDQLDFLMWAVAVLRQQSIPSVFSISWDACEGELSKEYVQVTNLVIAKLIARGVSIITASGDSGVTCQGSKTCFSASFFATCPFVTSVGGSSTILSTGECVANSNNTIGIDASQGMIYTTGGGFSQVIPRPWYQEPPFSLAVENYLSYSDQLPPPSYYNSGNRAFPDVVMQGIGAFEVVFGSVIATAGTSMSAPSFAGMIALCNDARALRGKNPLGLINPLLYYYHNTTRLAHFLGYPSDPLFATVEKGGNACGFYDSACCPAGFFAWNGGYSPVGGLGVPNFRVLREIAVHLP